MSGELVHGLVIGGEALGIPELLAGRGAGRGIGLGVEKGRRGARGV